MAPLPALTIGLVVMSRAGVPAGIWLRNVAATLVGVLVVVAALRYRSSSSRALPRWLCALGLALLGVTLMTPGVAGVHRWVGLGPLDVHVGAVVLPSLLVFLTDLDWALTVPVAALTMTVLLLQPDAAQASSFAAGWGVWAGMKRGRTAAAPITAAVIFAGATWLRNDPLQPVAYVEGIVGVAASQGAILGVASLLALALLPIPFFLNPKHQAGTALAVYTAGTIVAAWLGNYPVPVLGYGVSPILGYYLAVVALRRSGDRDSQSALAAT
jgi:cell division protein FtsW (lipid II flippase)